MGRSKGSGCDKCVDPLIQAPKDKDSQVREFAAAALDEIEERKKEH